MVDTEFNHNGIWVEDHFVHYTYDIYRSKCYKTITSYDPIITLGNGKYVRVEAKTRTKQFIDALMTGVNSLYK